MAEYVITPEEKEIPEGPYLMDELHRRGFPVEINIKGSAQNWESIRFYEPGPPEIECLLSRDETSGRLSLSIAPDAPPESSELQAYLADLILSRLGGRAENSSTRESFTPAEFSSRLKSLHHVPVQVKEIFWTGFSWVVVSAGVLLAYFSPHTHPVSLIVVFLSFVSAAGLTYSHFKS